MSFQELRKILEKKGYRFDINRMGFELLDINGQSVPLIEAHKSIFPFWYPLKFFYNKGIL